MNGEQYEATGERSERFWEIVSKMREDVDKDRVIAEEKRRKYRRAFRKFLEEFEDKP